MRERSPIAHRRATAGIAVLMLVWTAGLFTAPRIEWVSPITLRTGYLLSSGRR